MSEEAGIIYVMEALESYPGWVKVGLTRNDAKRRAKDMHTGSPHRDLNPVYEYPVFSVFKAEKEAHKILKGAGYVKKNEWFQCSPQAADVLIRGTMGEYASAACLIEERQWGPEKDRAERALKQAHKVMYKDWWAEDELRGER